MLGPFRVSSGLKWRIPICLSAEQGPKFGWEKFTGRMQRVLRQNNGDDGVFRVVKSRCGHYNLAFYSGMSNVLQQHADKLKQLIAPHYQGEVEQFASPSDAYRMRAEFRVWHQEGKPHYAVYNTDNPEGKRQIQIIESWPIVHESIAAIMPKLLAATVGNTVLTQKWFQVEFLATLSGDMLITLVYHRALDAEWETAARALAAQLGVHIIGRSRKQKIVLTQDYVTEALEVTGRTYRYRQIEGGFTQPNAWVCEKMLAWAVEAAGQNERDLLELYCGNGNFTLPLSRCFRQVLATEISKTSVHAAEWSIAENGCDNIKIARLSAEELTEAMNGVREFRRLQEAGINVADYDISTVFVDPPRAGIDDDTLKMLQGFERIIYISCNPLTLADNLNTLAQTHRIVKAAVFDQFPHTHHVEAGVLLERI